MTFSLVVVTVVTFLLPLLLARFKIAFLPTAVAEIIGGIIIGKSGFNLVETNTLLNYLSELGVIMLIFLSGLEIDFSLFKKAAQPTTPLAIKKAAQENKTSPLLVALAAYGLSLVAAAILAGIFVAFNLLSNFWLATILFATIGLGVVIATLKENELLSKPLGQALLLVAVLGEVVPMFALTVFATLYANNGGSLWLLSILLVVGAILFRRFRRFFSFYDRINKATTQVDVRLASFFIFLLVVIAISVGAEAILGAFIAGIVVNLLEPGEETRHKLDAIGYGLLIPFFFILSGVALDIPSLMSSPKTIILIPLIFIAFVIAKLPAFLGLRLRFTPRNSAAGAILSGTTITLVLTTLTVAKNLNAVSDQQYGAFILAAILTCIFAPPLFKQLFVAEPDDIQKRSVHIVGANLLALTAATQLNPDWYDITMYTNDKTAYNTYHSQVNLVFLPQLDDLTFRQNDAYDCDIFVVATRNYEQNYHIAAAAKRYGVERVIARFDTIDVGVDLDKRMKQLGIEFYKNIDVGVSVLRSLIETPATLKMLSDTDNRIYEVVVHNAKYAGMRLRDLPFIDEITISRILRQNAAIMPRGNTTIECGDHLLFMGSPKALPKIRELLDDRHNE